MCADINHEAGAVTILIAEDNLILSKSISRCLKMRGYSTKSVASVAETRSAIETQAFEALCLDLQLKDGTGLEILESGVKWQNPGTPVILMTGTGTERDRERAEKAGARAFLTKPFALCDLVGALERALSTQTTQRKIHAAQ